MKGNSLDQFYTNPIVANEIVKKFLSLLPEERNNNFVEPSAGTGNFIEALIKNGVPTNKITAFDIDPKNQENSGVKINQLDYLNTKISFASNRTIIGNPPFGHRGKIALEFLNKCLLEANTVAMILPNIFCRYSIQCKVNESARLVYSKPIKENSFLINDKSYGVKCVFQIWTNKPVWSENLRIKTKPLNRHKDFTTWIYNNTKETMKYFSKDTYKWDFAVVRQGFYNYNEKITNPNDLNKKRQYFFIKANSQEALDIINKIDFQKLSRTNTQVLGFSTTDFVREYQLIKGEI